jgi:hypothetical protein
MQALDDLVDLLQGPGGNLEEALFKAQVLAYRLEEPELAAWVEHELNGYPTDEVPDYRKITAHVMGTVVNPIYAQHNQKISLKALDAQQRDVYSTRHVTQGIGAIDLLVREEEKGHAFGVPVPPEICSLLSRAYNKGWTVQGATIVSAAGAHKQILTRIRSRLLAFALKLQANEQKNKEVTPGDLKQSVGNALNDLLNGANFGQNNNITINNASTVGAVHNNMVTYDLDKLMSSLEQLGLAPKDLADLKDAMDADAETEVEGEKKGIGQKVRGWVESFSKTASGAVISGGVKFAIERALRHFYGM